MISVVIPVFDRRDYYSHALNSLNDQTISNKDFEAIIVSNIPVEVPNLNFNCKLVLTDDQTLAGKLIIGIEKSEGEIISFLEDDDIFADRKLYEVKYAFNSQIVFYRNQIIKFHGKEYAVKFNGKSSESEPVINLFKPSSVKEVFNKMRLGINFNLSSISIRKSFALSIRESMAMLTVGYIDSFLFYSAIIKNKMIGYCSYGPPSTLVRVHMENSRNYFSSKLDFTEATFLHKAILSLVDKDNSSPSTNFILRMIHMDEMDESIKVRRPSRWVVLTEFLDLISDKYTFLLRRDLVLKSILYLISPRLMDLLLAAFRKI